MFSLFLGSMASGMPVAFAIMTASFVYFIISSEIPRQIFVQRLVAGVDSFTTLAVPFFVLAGTAMARGGIAARLFGLADALVGHMKGGLGYVNVLNSVFVGGMCGSANADAAIDCKTIVPIMVRHGYDRSFSAAITAASGIIAAIIPPSLGFVIYALIAEVSIGRMFVGGIIPGLMIAGALMAVVAWVSKKRGYGGIRKKRASWWEIFHFTKESVWALVMPVLLIVGLRLGVFTPTELGAIAALYALFVGIFVYKEIKPQEILGVLVEASLATCVIMFIISAASAMSYVITWENVPQRLIAVILEITEKKNVVLLLINAAFLILGCVFESLSLMIILTPLLAPVMQHLGVDLVHFGVVLTINVAIGGITPPVGTILYTVCGITGIPVSEFARDILPFLGALIFVLLLITYIPGTVLFLPKVVFG
ncbi:MAG: TRAP transporter large permease [Candidatus Methanomethylicaceae archaeon]